MEGHLSNEESWNLKQSLEALEQANSQLQGAMDTDQLLEARVKYYLHEAQMLEIELPLVREEVMKIYAANFHLTEEY